jgi:hypothetical protein
VKPLFTVHAGEFLVGCEIERKFNDVNIWIPAKDTGIDLLVSDESNKLTVSIQVKFSRDYLVTHMKDALFHTNLRATGWWTPTRQQIEISRAEYWVFVLVGFDNRSTDFIIIKPKELLKRLNAIHKKATTKFHSYLWVTKTDSCWEARGLSSADQLAIADGTFDKDHNRNFTSYLNNWEPIEALNG